MLNCVLRLSNVSSAQYNNTNANISEVCNAHGPVQLMVKNVIRPIIAKCKNMCVEVYVSSN